MTRRTLAYLAPALILAGAILLATFAPKARAAMEGLTETVHVVGWSVTLFWHDYEAAGRSHQRLSGYVATRAECEAIRQAVAVKIKGGKTRCDFTDELQVVR